MQIHVGYWEEARDGCAYCTQKEPKPHMHYILIEKDESEYNRYESIDDCMDEAIKQLSDEYDSYFEDGFFTTEGIFKEDYLSPKAIEFMAKRIFNQDKAAYTVRSLACTRLNEEEHAGYKFMVAPGVTDNEQ